jgi:hypothetical protein
MAGRQTNDLIDRVLTAPSATVWIDEHQAIVAAISATGRVSTCEIARGWLGEGAYLDQVVRVIGDRERVAILGPGSKRNALEREYVALYPPPDRSVEMEAAGPVSPEELIDRVRALAAWSPRP